MLTQAVRNLCVGRKVFLKHRVNWNRVCGAVRDLPWRNIWLANNLVEDLIKQLPLLVESFVHAEHICENNNKDLGVPLKRSC